MSEEQVIVVKPYGQHLAEQLAKQHPTVFVIVVTLGLGLFLTFLFWNRIKRR